MAGEYVDAGGQPGLRQAWADPKVNGKTGDFFSGTLETLEKAYLRPRFDGFIDAFEHMGGLVYRWACGEVDRKTVIADSNERFARNCARAAEMRN